MIKYNNEYKSNQLFLRKPIYSTVLDLCPYNYRPPTRKVTFISF